MKYIILFLLVHILLSSCLCDVMTNASFKNLNRDSIDVNRRDVKTPISSIKPIFQQKNHLTELITECLLLILDELSITDLISISQANRRLSILAADVFRRRFSSHEIEIVKDRSISRLPLQLIDDFSDRCALEKEDKGSLVMFKNRIEVYDFDITLLLLKQFGNVIRKLKIHTQKLQSNHSEIINKYISDFCAGSLVKFDLTFIRSKTLEQFTNPLNEVEDFSCSIDVYQIGNKTQPLNQLFPRLRRLSLFMVSDIDYSFLDCDLPHLEYLSLKGLHSSRFETAVAMDRLIRKNSQIRSIELAIFVPNFIKTVHKLLPNLERLTLAMPKIGNFKIHFEHVKFFEMILQSFGSPAQMTFGNLEELHFFYSNDQCDAWIEFLRKHQNISRLHVRNRWTESDLHEQFERITAKLPNLAEISIDSGRMIEADAIIKVIETHDKLIKFEITPS